MSMFNSRSQNDALRMLSTNEIDVVAGGVKPGPNGEGCTGSRRPTKGSKLAAGE